MAHPQPADPKKGDAPKLVAVSEDANAAQAESPPPAWRRWWPVALLALLLVLALGGLTAQTQRATAQAERIVALEGQVSGLEQRLATANEQLAAYDHTLGLVRGTVSELFARVADLNALVQGEPQGAEPAER